MESKPSWGKRWATMLAVAGSRTGKGFRKPKMFRLERKGWAKSVERREDKQNCDSLLHRYRDRYSI